MTPNPRYWPIADVATIKINATLLTFNGRYEQPVWMSHFGKLADLNGSKADIDLAAKRYKLIGG